MNQQPDQTNQQQQGLPGQAGFIDGMGIRNNADAAKTFLDPGETYEDLLIRSGMSVSDAYDWSEIYRLGIAIQSSRMVMHSYHAAIAFAGADRGARKEALYSIVGIPGNATVSATPKGLFSRIRKGKQTDMQSLNGAVND